MYDIKEYIHVDDRFKSDDTTHDTDFHVTLPRSLNLAVHTGCFVDENAIPISRSTSDSRTNTL
jgi:hypothetical protein